MALRLTTKQPTRTAWAIRLSMIPMIPKMPIASATRRIVEPIMASVIKTKIGQSTSARQQEALIFPQRLVLLTHRSVVTQLDCIL